MDKNQAITDFLKMIHTSWTYNRLTECEQRAISTILSGFPVRGSYSQRWDTLNAVYFAFLSGAGYNGPSWREAKETHLF